MSEMVFRSHAMDEIAEDYRSHRSWSWAWPSGESVRWRSPCDAEHTCVRNGPTIA
jgi:hypothetical protein